MKLAGSTEKWLQAPVDIGPVAHVQNNEGGVQEVAPSLEIVPAKPNAALDRIAPVSLTHTVRAHEVPYEEPPEMTTCTASNPLGDAALDETRRYVWLLTPGGELRVAPEIQPGFGVLDERPEGRLVNHGDLGPGPGGQTRGAARLGGELNFDGGVWRLDLNSSYAFNRTDGQLIHQPGPVVEGLREQGLLGLGIEPGKSTYNALRALGGKVRRVLHDLGLRGDPA